eukprot:NODE_2611_length_535_cov_69.100490_g2561_i0.p1 GENE.NODE_2611_length_535_cov_69.100490_g2561_i0~~NODE_2611_length_535_cov_69.100490_g2561_i0.p1  ORF type:complete len:110 (-),score=22.89 NODE_2611_length_535_cov_69.100490_g2561_i0:106-435(-)
MAESGATLQNTNNELVKCIEELRDKREESNRVIMKEEEEKARIVNEIHLLTERLNQIDEHLNGKYAGRAEYDKAISETETAFSKIVDSSKTLLHVLKRESTSLRTRAGA